MTYHAGIGPGFERVGLPIAPREPHVTCNNCGIVESAVKRDGSPKAWILARKAPPGWKLIRTEEPFSRVDLCPRCKTAATDTDSRNGSES